MTAPDTLPLSTWRTLAALVEGHVFVTLDDGAMFVEFGGGKVWEIEPADLAALEERGWVEIVEVDGEPRRVNVTQTGRYWAGKHQKRRGR